MENHANAATEEKAEPERIEKALQEFKPNAAMQAANAILPKSVKDVMDLAAVMSKSGLVPQAMVGKPEACAIAIMHGLELGISPTQAVSNIMVVNGRPSVWGDLMLALALGSGRLEYLDEDGPDKALTQQFGRCTVQRNGGAPITRVFSLDDAKRAGLLTKDTWRNYPGRMLMYRARSWALRDCIPDVLKGLQMREEVEEYGSEPVAPPAVPMPRRAKLAEMAQDAQIVENVDNPVKEENAQPAAASEATIETANTVGDAQEPVEANPDELIGPDERKELATIRWKAMIPVNDLKAWMKQTFNVDDTAKLTRSQAQTLTSWIQANKRQ